MRRREKRGSKQGKEIKGERKEGRKGKALERERERGRERKGKVGEREGETSIHNFITAMPPMPGNMFTALLE